MQSFSHSRPRLQEMLSMPHSIKTVVPLANHELQIHFRSGVTKRFDVTPLIESIDFYRAFLLDEKDFSRVRVSEDGLSVVWDNNVDLGCEELWRNGKDTKSIFDGLLSASDAAALWHIDESTLRKALSDGRLREGTDAMKFGKQWVITIKGMTRLYGSLENHMANYVSKMKLF